MGAKKFYLLVETDQLPICNQSTGAKNLFVDEVLRGTEREIAMQSYRKPFPYWSLVAILIFIIGIIWIFTE